MGADGGPVGATRLPRLVDMHVHLAFDASADSFTNLARDDDAALAAGALLLRR